MTPRFHFAATVVGATLLAIASSAQSARPVDAAYRESFEKWKSGLVDDLKQNWLTLAGLYWLQPGENAFGTAPDNKIVFPKGPPRAGTFTLNGNDVTVKFLPGANAKISGNPATDTKLDPDTSEHPTRVEMGSLRFYVIVRGKRVGIRLKDVESPEVKKYSGPVFYPLNLKYRVTAKWLPSDGKKTVDVPTVLGDAEPTPVAGTAVFKLNGQEMQLTDLGGDPKDELFFVFDDPTKKTETYPGGRFLKAGPVVNGTVELDFNRAYNPPCAITPYATCPLAPKENRLAVPVLAGEKYDHRREHR